MLMDHNIPVYEKFVDCLFKYKECIVVTATGTGKSYIIKEFLERYNETALVITPRNIINREWEGLSDRVTVITYQHFYRHYMEYLGQYKYIVFDEAHHVGGDGSWGEAFRDFKKQSQESKQDVYLIGLTAESKRSTGDRRDVAVTAFDGHLVVGYTQAEAVEANIIAKSRYYCALFDLPTIIDKYKRKAKRYDTEEINRLIGRLDFAYRNHKPIQQYLKDIIGDEKRKGIVFVDQINKISDAVNLIQSTFPDSPIYYIHSKMGKNQINKQIDLFKINPYGFMVAVNMFNEGLHIPGVDTIIMLRKTGSHMVYIQQIGRAMTASNVDRDILIFDFVGNATVMRKISKEIERQKRIEAEFGERSEIGIGKPHKPMISDQFIVDAQSIDVINVLEELNTSLKNARGWSEEFDNLIRSYDGKTRAELMESEEYKTRFSNKSAESVQVRAKQLGVNFTDTYQYSFFSEEEDELLRLLYPLSNTKDIVRFFNNRTYSALYTRANRLGLEKITESHILTNEEYEFIKTHYPVYGVDFCHDNLPYLSKQFIKFVAYDISTESKPKKLNNLTPMDDAIFREYFHKMTNMEFCRKFYPDVHPMTVLGRARKLGLKNESNTKVLSSPLSEETKKLLLDNIEMYLNGGYNAIKSLLPKGYSRSAIYGFYCRHGIRRGDNVIKIHNIIYQYADEGYSTNEILDLLKQNHNIIRNRTTINAILRKRKKGEA